MYNNVKIVSSLPVGVVVRRLVTLLLNSCPLNVVTAITLKMYSMFPINASTISEVVTAGSVKLATVSLLAEEFLNVIKYELMYSFLSLGLLQFS